MASSAQHVKELRDRTGAGVMDCKEALQASHLAKCLIGTNKAVQGRPLVDVQSHGELHRVQGPQSPHQALLADQVLGGIEVTVQDADGLEPLRFEVLPEPREEKPEVLLVNRPASHLSGECRRDFDQRQP